MPASWRLWGDLTAVRLISTELYVVAADSLVRCTAFPQAVYCGDG